MSVFLQLLLIYIVSAFVAYIPYLVVRASEDTISWLRMMSFLLFFDTHVILVKYFDVTEKFRNLFI
jgi:hypothetical protein